MRPLAWRCRVRQPHSLTQPRQELPEGATQKFSLCLVPFLEGCSPRLAEARPASVNASAIVLVGKPRGVARRRYQLCKKQSGLHGRPSGYRESATHYQ